MEMGNHIISLKKQPELVVLPENIQGVSITSAIPNLTHFEVDEEKEWRLKQEQKKRKRQEYLLQKKLQEEEEKAREKERAIKNMKYLLGKSVRFSKFFNNKLQEHTQERVKQPLKVLQSKDESQSQDIKHLDSSSPAKKFDITDKLKYFKGVLKPFQVEGVAWLSILFENEVNGILADEMGLGKTVEVIALISHLYERKVEGPYMVVAPLSTLLNWASEFRRFAPAIPVVVFQGSQDKRLEIRDIIKGRHTLEGQRVEPVVITTYEVPIIDKAFLRKFKWQYIIVDEGHRLKNSKCRLAESLNSMNTANKLLLTGTPLQNNMSELWALLNFLQPHMFKDARTFDALLLNEELQENTATSEVTGLISTLHSILAPFMLRRLKRDVLINLPPKKEVLVYCPISQLQKDLYTYIIQKDLDRLMKVKHVDKEETDMPSKKRACNKNINYNERALFKYEETRDREDVECLPTKNEKKDDSPIQFSSYITMQSPMTMYRKVVNHPYLAHMPLDPNCTKSTILIDENLVNTSGKMLVLDAMLPKLKQRKHKVLIFSTLVMMLDIIEEYAEMRGYSYCRLDGKCTLPEREKTLETFSKDPDMFLFLISIRAGGLGLNITAADTVIIYDSDWNPQIDIQAQDRCHRIGQTKPVMVYTLVTKNTIDERIIHRGNTKKKLDKLVIKDGKFKTLGTEVQGEIDLKELKELQELIKSDACAQKIHANGYVFSDEELDKLLDRSELYKEMEFSKMTNKEN